MRTAKQVVNDSSEEESEVDLNESEGDYNISDEEEMNYDELNATDEEDSELEEDLDSDDVDDSDEDDAPEEIDATATKEQMKLLMKSNADSLKLRNQMEKAKKIAKAKEADVIHIDNG